LADPNIPPKERNLERLQDEGFLLVAAGTETTARGLTMACFYIAQDHWVHDCLLDELRTIMFSPDTPVSWVGLENLPYLVSIG
jgi:cytochrome P450